MCGLRMRRARVETLRKTRPRMAYSTGDFDATFAISTMTVFSLRPPRCTRLAQEQSPAADRAGGHRSAPARSRIVAYLLWPTWSTENAGAPDRLPVSIGGTLFNVPTAAIRMKIQRHSGPQERIDLNFSFPRWSRRSRRSMSAPTRSTRRRSRSTASSCRSPPITIRSRRTCACARSIRAISSRPRRPARTG